MQRGMKLLVKRRNRNAQFFPFMTLDHEQKEPEDGFACARGMIPISRVGTIRMRDSKMFTSTHKKGLDDIVQPNEFPLHPTEYSPSYFARAFAHLPSVRSPPGQHCSAGNMNKWRRVLPRPLSTEFSSVATDSRRAVQLFRRFYIFMRLPKPDT